MNEKLKRLDKDINTLHFAIKDIREKDCSTSQMFDEINKFLSYMVCVLDNIRVAAAFPEEDKKSVRYFMCEMAQEEYEKFLHDLKLGNPYKFNVINKDQIK